VFSPDLDGEFDTHHDTAEGFENNSSSQMAISGHPAHTYEYVEFGFSFLSDSTDRKLSKPLSATGLFFQSIAIRIVVPPPSVAVDSAFTLTLPFLTRDISSRAPPSLLI